MNWKIAICGLGAAAVNIHLPAYKKLADAVVVGGYDPSVAEQTFSFPLFDFFDDMLVSTQADIVVIATPTDSHYELTKKALEAGCHVLCEKPFMNSLEEAKEIVALAEELDRTVVVNNQYRFMQIHEASRKMINSTEFGQLLFMSASQTFYRSEQTEDGWRGQDTQRTCKEFGIHVLDLARFYFDENPVSIRARMPRGDVQDGPDYLNLIELGFSGDRVAHITLDRLSRGPHRYLDIRLDGSHGVIESSIGGKLGVHAGIRGGSRKPYLEVDMSPGGQARFYKGENFRKIASDPLALFANATGKLMAAFIHALSTGTTPPCNAADNIHTLALVFAAYESSRTNQTIFLEGRNE
jgi:predicted dehydrogenase